MKPEYINKTHDLPCGFRLHEHWFRYPDLDDQRIDERREWSTKDGAKLWSCELSVYWSLKSQNWEQRLNGDRLIGLYKGKNYVFAAGKGRNYTEEEINAWVDKQKAVIRRCLSGEEVPEWDDGK